MFVNKILLSTNLQFFDMISGSDWIVLMNLKRIATGGKGAKAWSFEKQITAVAAAVRQRSSCHYGVLACQNFTVAALRESRAFNNRGKLRQIQLPNSKVSERNLECLLEIYEIAFLDLIPNEGSESHLLSISTQTFCFIKDFEKFIHF